jgi:hypothetical protein
MTPPRKTSFENVNSDFSTPRYFSDFPRIQIKRRVERNEDDFRALSLQDRMELMEKLIDRVKQL